MSTGRPRGRAWRMPDLGRTPWTARLGLGLGGTFPAVLLTGSVVHEKVPWQQTAIHAGDWLITLLVVSLVVGGRDRRRHLTG